MSPFKLLFFVSAALCMLSSCQSSKIAYGNSYYFKQTPRHVNTAVHPVHSSDFQASVSDTYGELPTTTVLPSAPSLINPSESETEKVSKKQTITEKKTLRKERRAQRKEFRTAVKELFKAKDNKADQQEVTGLSKAAIIVAAAGAVMLVVGILANGAFLTTLGGIFLAIGLVLILLKIL